jgi:hypothetical protein
MPPARSGLDIDPALRPACHGCNHVRFPLKIGNDFVGDSAVNVLFLAHGLPLSLLVSGSSADEPLPVGETGAVSGMENLRDLGAGAAIPAVAG